MCVHVFVCVCAESVEEGRERMVNDSRIETKARGKKIDLSKVCAIKGKFFLG